jgi:hypothetical protein
MYHGQPYASVDLMTESTLSRSQGLRIWPPRRFITGFKSTLHEALFPVHNVYSADPDPDFQVDADPDSDGHQNGADPHADPSKFYTCWK